MNVDTTLQNRIIQNGKYNTKRYGKGELADVVVTSKPRVEGSENLNGAGNYDAVITETELQQMGDSTLLQVLKSKLKNFTAGDCKLNKVPHLFYMLNGSKVKFIFDGVKLDFFYDSATQGGTMDPYFQFINDYIKYYTAKDIKGIEVMEPGKYADTYSTSYDYVESEMNDCSRYTYIEITTYGKAGPFITHNATIDIYRPQPFSYGKEFYQPKYINRQLRDSLPDIRSTIYWNPLIVTDKNGEANFSFYSASSATDYLFWLEGMDMNGHLGFKAKKIEVKDE
ncbi:MAG: hypothetical protein PW786_03895 [Arachidicoccus sp.]|nr:hypothetical protein [Arachidicoccus sp.]